MHIINCRSLTKQYGNKLALDNLTFSVDENKIIGLIGRNGAGKTTFLKTCAGYIKPTNGNLSLWGEKVFDNLNVLSKMIFIDEEVRYDTTLRLKDILTLAKVYYENWDEQFARSLLNYFGLKDKLKYAKLSRGMKTQFNIIMGISSRMPLTLFDEPTLGLDAAFRKDFYSILIKDYINHPRTIIVSSHMLHELENLLEEIILIDNGKVLMKDSIDVFQNYGVTLNGAKDKVIPFINQHDVLYKNELGSSIIAGIKNDLTRQDMVYLANNNIDISSISSEDICIYLSSNGKEGGFDGFQ